MSKLVLFLFLGVCVMAVHMAPYNDDIDDEAEAALEDLINKLEPEILNEFKKTESRVKWKKVWDKSKPILIEAGKIAAGAAVSGIVG